MTTLIVDGSRGEGGGQILRTSLSLATLTGRPVQLTHIRAGRSRPGLRPQHLTAVRALAQICNATLSGDEIDSQALTFRPGSPPQGGPYTFDVETVALHGSAGAASLVALAVLWPLLFAEEPSRVVIRGGTHVPFSPPFHYLAHVARPAFARLGASFEIELDAWGWMPQGKGALSLEIRPVRSLQAGAFVPEAREPVQGVAAVTNLPSHIPQRMARRASNLLDAAGLENRIEPRRERGVAPGAGLFLWVAQAGASMLGRQGLPAEEVAEAAVAELLAFADNETAAVDAHLADQLLLPMVLAHGHSTFTTNQITQHTITHAALLRRWFGTAIAVEGREGQPGRVSVEGAGWSR
ncbi:MAG: RNA 3'-terminal phosphate cyclase [Anaerolineae bacterium]|nr:RNA 3'-terminal phosphate cyclase [Anaerolineae bacterium]